MRIRKKKTGIYESTVALQCSLWIPVFFGREPTVIRFLAAVSGLCMMASILMYPPEKKRNDRVGVVLRIELLKCQRSFR